MQTDPIGYYDAMNLYQYCGNNPVNWIDPWGLDTLGVHTTPGHSWITYTADDGTSTRHDLYDGGMRTGRNEWREDAGYKYASRYYDLTDAQERKFEKWIRKKQSDKAFGARWST